MTIHKKYSFNFNSLPVSTTNKHVFISKNRLSDEYVVFNY